MLLSDDDIEETTGPTNGQNRKRAIDSDGEKDEVQTKKQKVASGGNGDVVEIL